MQAIQLENYGIENLKIAEVPTPIPGENEVLVRTTAVSLQYLDLLTVENRVGLNIPLPFIPVSEGVGLVESVGKNVERWEKEDRVLIPFIPRWEAGKTTPYHNTLRTGMQTSGTMAEFTVQPDNTLVRTPENLTDEEAASLSVEGLTAWAMLVTQANIKAGQTILIQGSGGVSLFALQIAKMSGLKVIATTGARKRDRSSKIREQTRLLTTKSFQSGAMK